LQVNDTIAQLDKLTQENAAMAEQASAAGQSMSEQSRQLTDLLARFNVGSPKPGALRQALEQTVPHAFSGRKSGAPAKPTARTRAGAHPVIRPTAKPARATVTKAVVGDEGWENF
jgi:methyl-accepting chemotaxis protein